MLSPHQCQLHEVMGWTDNISMELPPIDTGVEEAVIFTLQNLNSLKKEWT